MKSKFSFHLIAACIISLGVLGVNPVSALPLAGDSEIQISGGAFHSQGSHTGSFNADINYGYYLSPGWELGFRQAVNYNFIDHAPDAWQATTLLLSFTTISGLQTF